MEELAEDSPQNRRTVDLRLTHWGGDGIDCPKSRRDTEVNRESGSGMHTHTGDDSLSFKRLGLTPSHLD